MVGQFSGPPTGEKLINNEVQDIFLELGFFVSHIDSCLISNIDKVGGFSFFKFLLSLKMFFRSTIFVNKVDVLYATPGQSFFGVIRFIPIIYLFILFKKDIYLHWHGYGVKYLIINNRWLKGLLFNNRITHLYLTEDLNNKMNEICGNSAASFVLKNFNNLKLSLEPNNSNSNSKLNVLFLGSLIESKGIRQFVNASKEVDFDFNVCGMGGDVCLDYVLSAESEGFLKYHGVVHGKIKEQLFYQADIFVLQTSYKIEGVPLALLEAMASGCAVLTTQHNGIPETVGDSGLFLEDLTSKELISKINYLDKNRKILVDYQQKAFSRSKDFKREHFKSQIKTIIERC